MVAAIVGKNYTMSVSFTNEDGTPFSVSKPVSYNVYAFDDSFIVGGSAIQSQSQPQEWYAYFAIPSNAPIPNDSSNQKYRIEWNAENTELGNNSVMKAVEYFEVLDLAEPLSHDSALSLLIGQPIKDYLITEFPVDFLNLTIMDVNDNVVLSKDLQVSSILRNNSYVTYIDAGVVPNVTDRGMGMCPYLLIYSYMTPQGQYNEVHTLYLVSARAMIIVNAMRRYLDKARNEDIDPNLRWTDSELIHFVVQGLNRFNVSAPSITNFTISNFPESFIYLIEKCAELEALNALYLAEGMRAGMEFTGASVTLNIDRTQYIQYKIDEIKSYLDENLQKEKKLLIRQFGGMGITGVQMTSVTNAFNRFYNKQAMARLIRRY